MEFLAAYVLDPEGLHWELGKAVMLVLFLAFAGLLLYYTMKAKKGKDVYIRPIAGLAAMNEAIGRATEMGRPVLYVPGIADVDDIQTIASLIILSEVTKVAAAYDTRTIVTCRSPLVYSVAEEMVKNACADAGRPDVFNSDDIRFLSDDQFAFTAGTTGIMLREKPATNIYLGAFWAESLILAETGFLSGAIQIAGTANPSQLPFFVAACDYTLIGEELYAASAYLSKEPKIIGTLKGSDAAKVLFAILILVGVVIVSVDPLNDIFKDWFGPESKGFREFFLFGG